MNRGPDSLAVLRWARELGRVLGERLVVVQGNHDLHLQARWHGVAEARPRDTLEELLDAEDAGELVTWLERRPFFYQEGETLLVHAGLLPDWTATEAQELSTALEAALRRGDRALLERSPAGGEEGERRRLRLALEAFTRLRSCRADGSPCDFSGHPDEAPEGCLPWYRVPGRSTAGLTVIFGHWAALGLHQESGAVCLDSACVWGGGLSAMRLEDRRIVIQPPHPEDPIPRE